MKNLLFILFCIPLFAQVPNTNTFTMQDVADEIGVSYSGRTLTELFGLATGTFDPNYVGSKNSLLNFRNYKHVSGLRYEGINLAAPDARGIYVSNFGNWAAYATNGTIKTFQLSTSFNISSVSNTYTFNTSEANSAKGVSFSYNGSHMYILMGDRSVRHSDMTSSPFRPDLGEVLVEKEIGGGSQEGFFMNSNGGRVMYLLYDNGIVYINTGIPDVLYSVVISSSLDLRQPMPSLFYGVYGRYHYFARVVGGEVEVTQYISNSPYNVDGIDPINPESVKLVQNLPNISSVDAIYPSSNGLYLYLNAVGTDGVRRIWQITMTGTNIL